MQQGVIAVVQTGKRLDPLLPRPNGAGLFEPWWFHLPGHGVAGRRIWIHHGWPPAWLRVGPRNVAESPGDLAWSLNSPLKLASLGRRPRTGRCGCSTARAASGGNVPQD